MSDNELLLAISDMMDVKLKTELQPLKNDMQNMQSKMQKMETDIQQIQADMQDLKAEVHDLKAEVQNLKTDVQNLKTDVQKMEANVQKMEIDLQNTQEEIQRIKLFQENNLLPRLNTIESCYTDTYHRYRAYADRMETAFLDIDLLKRVVGEHSVKLQSLA